MMRHSRPALYALPDHADAITRLVDAFYDCGNAAIYGIAMTPTKSGLLFTWRPGSEFIPGEIYELARTPVQNAPALAADLYETIQDLRQSARKGAKPCKRPMQRAQSPQLPSSRRRTA